MPNNTESAAKHSMAGSAARVLTTPQQAYNCSTQSEISQASRSRTLYTVPQAVKAGRWPGHTYNSSLILSLRNRSKKSSCSAFTAGARSDRKFISATRLGASGSSPAKPPSDSCACRSCREFGI